MGGRIEKVEGVQTVKRTIRLMECRPNIVEVPCDRSDQRGMVKCKGCPRCHISTIEIDDVIVKEPRGQA